MVRRLQNRGFSLAEVMMATGILAIGFVFIASVFPVGIKLTAVATEQTIAPIVADEAIAKIKLYGEIYSEPVTDPNIVNLVDELKKAASLGNAYVDFADVLPDVPRGEFGEFTYPSTDITPERKKYHWSALCGLLGDGNVHVTVFVTRISGAGTRFLTHVPDYTLPIYGQAVLDPDKDDRPVPVKVEVSQVSERRLRIIEEVVEMERSYINGGSTIVDDATGQIYRVLERDRDATDEIVLDRAWEGPAPPAPVSVWVVPPAVGSSRYPCIGIYQRVISF